MGHDERMLIIASDEHRAHHSLELSDGRLMDSWEGPDRADLIADALRSAGHTFAEPAPLDLELVGRIHTAEYVELLATAWDRWQEQDDPPPAAMGFTWPTRGLAADRRPSDLIGQLGFHSFAADCSIVAGTWSAVQSAAAAAVTATDRVLDGTAAYALCRPPGHHATADQFGGYCYLNNAAVAAQHLRDRGASRVTVLDVDYHHGNGTQSIFYDRNDVHFVSIHADPVEEFPWFAGHADERGTGAGEGWNLNLPLPRGTGRAAWFDALTTAVQAITTAGTDAVVVSLGVDTFEDDPLGTFDITTDDFTRMAEAIGETATSLGAPLVVIQEGGYATEAIGANVNAFLTPLC